MKFIDIGKIINTHGLDGCLKVFPITDNPKRFDALSYVYINKKDNDKKYEIEYIKYHKNLIILKLKEINDINEAVLLKEKYISIDRENAVKLPDNTFFICDLIGLDVFDVKTGFLGKIIDVIETGSNDVYQVKGKSKNDILIPALKSVIEKVDLKDRKMLINLPKGLIDNED